MSSPSSPESEGLTSASSGPDTGSSRSAKPTKRPAPSSGDTGPTSRSTKTSADSTASGWQAWDSLNDAATDLVPTMGQNTGMASGRAGVVFQSTSSAEDSRAKTSQSRESEPDSQANAPDCSLRPPESLTLFSETADGFSLRMFPDSFPQTADEISPSYSRRWPTSGFTTSLGECWTADTSECHNEGGAFSSLPDVLVADVPPRFYLSPKAAAGIIRRAEKRGRALPDELDQSLRTLSTSGEAEQTTTTHKPTISSLSQSRPNGEKDQADPHSTDKETEPSSLGRLAPALIRNPAAVGHNGADDQILNVTVATQSVRRPTPTECERLQGFPDGWTIP